MKENKFLFLYLSAFFVGSFLLLFSMETGQMVIFFSNHRSEFLNSFFKVTNWLGEEWAYILIGLVILPFNYRHTIGIGITSLVVTIFTQALKFGFKHPRPMLVFQKEGIADQIVLVEGIVPNVGVNSFPSGHTAAAFALFVFVALIFREKRYFPLVMITLAILGGLARVYLVQHFFKDVVFGAFIGVIAAMLSFYFQKLLWKNNISSLHF